MIHQHYYTRAKHKECITEMAELTDIYTVFDFCIMNMYKYSYRAGLKTKSKEPDLDKITWYKNYASYCMTIMHNPFRRRRCLAKYNIVCKAVAENLNN